MLFFCFSGLRIKKQNDAIFKGNLTDKSIVAFQMLIGITIDYTDFL